MALYNSFYLQPLEAMKFLAKLFARNEIPPEQGASALPVLPDHEVRLQAPVASPSTLDAIQRDLFDSIESTQDNFFIQGQAGTGKSTFVQYLKDHSSKRLRVVCPTAIAALNVGGVTIHSLFQFPFSDFFIFENLEVKRKTAQILQKTDLLIIDEVSMVRPDMLDAIDLIARQARTNDAPFGGLQVLLIGDLCQLPPVITSGVKHVFEREYGHKEAYFFDAAAYRDGGFKKVELTKVYRQSDPDLLLNLAKIRQDDDIEEAVAYFNTAKIHDMEIIKTSLTITPYRRVADGINAARLEALQTPLRTYPCAVSGQFDDKAETPAPRVLALKVGALVIFNRNISPECINGTSGAVAGLDDDVISVRLRSGKIVPVARETWQKFAYEYSRDTGKVEEKEVGRFTQFPLQLGYALTIHKAQGKTLDKVIIDMDRGTFAHGQLYVALSRTRTKADMHILKRVDESDVILDKRVVEFLGYNPAR